MSLLCVLVGVAFFSVVVSLIFNMFYFVLSSILGHPHLAKVTPQFGRNHSQILKFIFPLMLLFLLHHQHNLQGEEGGRSKLLENQ